MVDLGMSPLANAFVEPKNFYRSEKFYPLRAMICRKCYLVQLKEFEVPAKIFGYYYYFSSFSSGWLKHAQTYAEMAIKRFKLSSKSLVVEIASNDGYLLQYFKKSNIPVLGIEPASNVAQAARKKNIRTLVEFFGLRVAKKLSAKKLKADLVVANNVLAHVPNLNDFVAGIHQILKKDGVVTIEVPHLLQILKHIQFDTIYHEHFSYFSLFTTRKVLSSQGLRIFDVEKLETHGGSLRIYACHQGSSHPTSARVRRLLKEELTFGLARLSTYRNFGKKVQRAKQELLGFLNNVKNRDKTIVAYGAAAKGNTLLNYCGIGPNYLDYVVDRNPHKQGTYLPGSHLPVLKPEVIKKTKPDYLLILPWNIKKEILRQMAYIRRWGGQFVLALPKARVLS